MGDSNHAIFLPPRNGHWDSVRTLAGAFLASFSSAATRDAYGDDLRQWFAWCDAHDVDPLEVRRPHVELYMRWQEGRGLAPNTRGRRLSTLRSFFGWLVDEQVVPANPAARVKPPRRTEPELPSLSRHEMHRFLVTAAEIHPYDFAAVAVLGLCALRVSEATGADIGQVSVHNWTPRMLVHGKGAKDRTVAVPPMAMSALERAWDGRDLGPLLLNRHDRRMTRENVAGIIARVADAADIDKALTPHSMRRSAIQIALDAGVPLRDVQRWVGHASANTTLAYDRRAASLDRSPGLTVQQAVA